MWVSSRGDKKPLAYVIRPEEAIKLDADLPPLIMHMSS